MHQHSENTNLWNNIWYITTDRTECHGDMVNAPSSYSEGPKF